MLYRAFKILKIRSHFTFLYPFIELVSPQVQIREKDLFLLRRIDLDFFFFIRPPSWSRPVYQHNRARILARSLDQPLEQPPSRPARRMNLPSIRLSRGSER